LVESNEFLTSDTPLAAYLIQEGFDLIIIQYEEKRNGKQRATFVFNDANTLQDCVRLFNRGEAMINLALYEHAKSSLIDRIMRGLP